MEWRHRKQLLQEMKDFEVADKRRKGRARSRNLEAKNCIKSDPGAAGTDDEILRFSDDFDSHDDRGERSYFKFQ